MNDWIKEAPFAITVCDKAGQITEMNDKAGEVFSKWGGLKLIGADLLACHNNSSKEIIKQMLADENAGPNIYTVEKNGLKKLVYQCPVKQNGKTTGLVELSITLPDNMPHHIRK